MNWYLASLGALMIASLGDYLTTVVGVSSGTMNEANPTAVEFMSNYGVFAGFALLSVIGIVLIMALSWPLYKVDWRGSTLGAHTSLAVFAGLKLFATVWNLSIILS